MIRALALLMALATPVFAQDTRIAEALANDPQMVEALAKTVEVATARAAVMREVIADNGIQMSQMQPDGTVNVALRNGTSRTLQLDFIGGYHAGECRWALQYPGGAKFNFVKSLMTQARLTEEDWPAFMIDTTSELTAADCMARSSFVVLDDGCLAMLPITGPDTILHFALDMPEFCQ